MKRILFQPIFRSGHKCILHALEFAKIVQGELVLLHTFELASVFDNQFFRKLSGHL
jgi:hypothetical protein